MWRVTGECLPCIPVQWELNDRPSISLSKHGRGPSIAFPIVTVGIVLFFFSLLQMEFKQLSSRAVKHCLVKPILFQAVSKRLM